MGRVRNTLALACAALIGTSGCCLEIIEGGNRSTTAALPAASSSSSAAASSSSSTGGVGSSTGTAATSSAGTTAASSTGASSTGSSTGGRTSSGTSGAGATSGTAGCVIDGQYYPPLTIGPSSPTQTNPAQCCNPGLSGDTWSPLFVKVESFEVGSDTIFGPNDGVVADLNADGLPDVAITTTVRTSDGGLGDAYVWFYLSLNATYGVFGGPTNHAVGQAHAWLAAGDLDHDGVVDLAFVDQDSLTFALGTGLGGFGFEHIASNSCGPGPIQLFDSNLTGYPLIAGGGACGVFVWQNGFLPGAQDQPPAFAAAGEPESDVAIGDFDGDGLPDVAYIDAHGRLAWLQSVYDAGLNVISVQDAPSVIGLAGLSPSSSTLAGVMGDGELLTSGPGPFGPLSKGELFFPTVATLVATGDVDGDGLPDLVFGAIGDGGQPILGIALNDGSPLPVAWSNAVAQSAPGAQAIRHLVVADMNGDGFGDVVVFREQGPWEVWVNTCGPGAAAVVDAGLGN